MFQFVGNSGSIVDDEKKRCEFRFLKIHTSALQKKLPFNLFLEPGGPVYTIVSALGNRWMNVNDPPSHLHSAPIKVIRYLIIATDKEKNGK